MSILKVSYGTTKIQALRRVTLDQNLLETLGMDIGDMVKIELDTQQGAVLITPMNAASNARSKVTPAARRSRAGK